jgi:hypothetical protein
VRCISTRDIYIKPSAWILHDMLHVFLYSDISLEQPRRSTRMAFGDLCFVFFIAGPEQWIAVQDVLRPNPVEI